MIDEIRHKNYHDNPAYHFEKEKSTAKILNYELDKNSDIEYQIIDDEATRWLYGTLMALLIIIIINILLL